MKNRPNTDHQPEAPHTSQKNATLESCMYSCRNRDGFTSPPSSRLRGTAADQMDLRVLGRALAERIWLIITCFLVATIGTAAYLRHAPRIYAATATLHVEQQEQRIVKFEKVQQEDLRFGDMLQTIVQTVGSRPVLERVVSELGLTGSPSSAGDEVSREEAAGRLGKAVDARLRRGTRLIDVTVKGTDPALAEKLANTIVRQYIKFSFEQQSASSQIASEFLVEEAERLKKRLQDSEGKLQTYKEEVRSISLEDRHDIVTSRLRELSQKVNEAKTARTRLEVEHRQVQKLGSNVTALLVLPSVASDPSIASIVMTLSKLQNEFSNLRQRYLEKHPKYIQAFNQVKDWGNTLTNAVLKTAQTIEAAYENALGAERALEKALADQEKLALELGKLGIRFNVLQREIESDRALYDSVLTRLKETNLTKELQSDKVRILQLATLPRLPISPNSRKVLTLGMAGGLAAGIGLVLALRAVDASVKSVDQVEELLGAPAVAAIEQSRGTGDKRWELVILENRRGAAEGFRTLRTAVSMLGRRDSRRTLLFTSAVPAEGKTFCAANYALSLAQTGLRTILIDADLRRPAVERALLGKGTRRLGLADFLTGQTGFDEILYPAGEDGLWFIPAGTLAPNPSELLAQSGFSALMEEALRHADRVVVDSAPILAVSDTLLLAPHVQTVLMVLRAGKTSWKTCARAMDAMQKAGLGVSGIVLNGVRNARLGGYGYGYGDG